MMAVASILHVPGCNTRVWKTVFSVDMSDCLSSVCSKLKCRSSSAGLESGKSIIIANNSSNLKHQNSNTLYKRKLNFLTCYALVLITSIKMTQ